MRIQCWFHRLANIRAKLPDETAGEGLVHVHAVARVRILEQRRAADTSITKGDLTPRQQEILRLVATGSTIEEIA